jgi:hypothetical protein
MLKIKLKKSNIMKLSDIDYFQTLIFNIKYYIFENIIQKCFSLSLNNNKEFMKLFLKYHVFKNQLIIMKA